MSDDDGVIEGFAFFILDVEEIDMSEDADYRGTCMTDAQAKEAVEIRDSLVWTVDYEEPGEVPQWSFDDSRTLRVMGILV